MLTTCHVGGRHVIAWSHNGVSWQGQFVIPLQCIKISYMQLYMYLQFSPDLRLLRPNTKGVNIPANQKTAAKELGKRQNMLLF
jgi:hypothetical protein